MKKYVFILIVVFILTSAVIYTSTLIYPGDVKSVEVQKTEEGAAKIAVISDVHYFSPELGDKGEAFEKYLQNDRKLLSQSSSIFRSIINTLKKSDAKIILVTGDLTKDGELVNHKHVAQGFKDLENAGKKVYVIDGNHDINNPNAFKYQEFASYPVKSISPQDFVNIYRDFGYDEAISRDPNSLSYVVEPVKGLRIIAMDSCIYDTNLQKKVSTTSGRLKSETLQWVKEQLLEAKRKNIKVIGMMHHGLLSHFAFQEKIFPEYIIKDWQEVSTELGNLGMRAVFTGHFHAQDIAKKSLGNGQAMYDIETGSLVTYPCPYRFVDIDKNGIMKINSKSVEIIDYNLKGKTLNEFAKNSILTGFKEALAAQAYNYLVKHGTERYQAQNEISELSHKKIGNQFIIDSVTNAIASHYRGDEKIDKRTKEVINYFVASKDTNINLFGMALYCISSDSYPGDNRLEFSIKTGKILK